MFDVPLLIVNLFIPLIELNNIDWEHQIKEHTLLGLLTSKDIKECTFKCKIDKITYSKS